MSFEWDVDESGPMRLTGGDVVDGTFPHSLTILATYRCTAACSNCCFGSNPFIQKRVAQDRLLAYIDEAAATFPSMRVIVFSGGEAMMLQNDLIELVARCHSHGFGTRIVSNGYWAATMGAARKRLGELRAAGLTELNISTGDAHMKWVSYSTVVNALVAALELGMTTCLVVESTARSGVTKQWFEADTRVRTAMREFAGRGRLIFLQSAWMENFDGPVEAVPSHLVNRETLARRGGCASIFNTIVVTPNEQLGMCCGLTREQIPELNVGDLRGASFAALFDEGCADLIKIWIFLEGPEQMLAQAAERDPSIDWETSTPITATHAVPCMTIAASVPC